MQKPFKNKLEVTKIGENNMQSIKLDETTDCAWKSKVKSASKLAWGLETPIQTA